MIEIEGVTFLEDIYNILIRLRKDLRKQRIHYLSTIKKGRDNIQITCPKHSGGLEKRASCGVSTKEIKRFGKIYPAGTVNCFTCGYITDLPGLISFCFGKDDQGYFGFKWLVNTFGSVSSEDRKEIVIDIGRESNKNKENIFVSDEELDRYRYTHSYMYERKLTDKVINYFDVGYDQETNCLTFPVKNIDGKTVFIFRRSVSSKYFNIPEYVNKGDYLYGLYEINNNLFQIKEVWICEAILDALICWVRGKFAVALMQAIPTNRQIELLESIPVRKFVIGLDNDRAGSLGVERLGKQIKSKLLYRALIPAGKDLNDLSLDEFINLGESLLELA